MVVAVGQTMELIRMRLKLTVNVTRHVFGRLGEATPMIFRETLDL